MASYQLRDRREHKINGGAQFFGGGTKVEDIRQKMEIFEILGMRREGLPLSPT